MHIHLIEPFYSGSHKLWVDQLSSLSQHSIDLVSLPGRHWKWRMQSSAPILAKRSNQLGSPDLYLLTDMVNVAEFRSLLSAERRNIPCVLYMHENQVTYPWSPDDEDIDLQRDHTYGLINLKSCVAADHVIFNSEYHRNDFLKSLEPFLAKFPDNYLLEFLPGLGKKSIVLSVGVELPLKPEKRYFQDPPVILWNHRWEYDKGPDEFFKVMYNLRDNGYDFQLIVCGESGNKIPDSFSEAQEKLRDRIIHWGYAKSRNEYMNLLKKSDILPVTNRQDFFGISIIEAIGHGVYPLLPNRLAYPEHIPPDLKEQLLYNSRKDLIEKLENILDSARVALPAVIKYIQKYRIDRVVERYDEFFMKIK